MLFPDNDLTKGHMADEIFNRSEWGHMPYYPQFNKNPSRVGQGQWRLRAMRRLQSMF